MIVAADRVVVLRAAGRWPTSLRILKEYERGVAFRLGRLRGAAGPGRLPGLLPGSTSWCGWTCAW